MMDKTKLTAAHEHGKYNPYSSEKKKFLCGLRKIAVPGWGGLERKSSNEFDQSEWQSLIP